MSNPLQHFEFLGIPIDGSARQFVAKLEESGFVLDQYEI